MCILTLISRLHLIALLIVTTQLLSSCAGKTPEIFYAYFGEPRGKSEIAILKAVTAEVNEINGKEFLPIDESKYYQEIHIAPDTYNISLYRWFGISVLVVPEGYVHGVSSTYEIELKPERIYELHADRTTGYNFQLYYWIVDKTSGEVVAGMPKPE